ncbi:ATP-binding protein [Nitrososphaera sp.]|uniref:ATP-binding protein n=1 Tax=Nitrososphaera sp. TaxID=1971748 RepID=UPI0017BC023C|nr:ATP-binding protein [Nitrososphaera sp.]NWG36693.1 ATP-binding protein [Nitrososphaera sp.]
MGIAIDLVDQNPWWKKREVIGQDKHLTELEKSSVKWQPRIRYKFNLGKDIVYTLRGPRQVGKTTLLKSMIRDLLGKVPDPRLIFYYTCDLIDNPKELVGTVNSYLDSTRPDRKKRAYLFLDEISSVRDWQKAIKHLSDTGKLTNTTIILTGSHTLDIKKAYEKLPGRRGILDDVPDKILLPMKFVEYVETINQDLQKTLSKQQIIASGRRIKLLQELSKGNVPKEIKELSLYSKDLELLFNSYLMTGGIPRVTDEYLRTGKISEGIYRTYIDVVLGDLARWNKKETYLRQILRRIFITAGNPVSWNTLKDDTDVSSHNTIAEYIDTLKDSFVLYYVSFYDIARKLPSYQKNKKIHFYDPFFFHALRAWIGGQDPFVASIEFLKDSQNVGMLTESIVGSHLIRLAFCLSQQKQLFDYENSLFYWKSSKDREIDFVIKLGDNSVLPIEIKYQSSILKSDRYGIIDFKKSSGTNKGILLSKDKTEVKAGIVTIPIWIFLMLI